MKIGIYLPFAPTLGGGERYCLSIAEILSRKHDVCVISQFDYNLDVFSEAFNLNLKRVNFLRKEGFTQFFAPVFTREYDLFICLSNHIVPPTFSWGKRSLLIIQFPFPYPHQKFGDKLQFLLKNFKTAKSTLSGELTLVQPYPFYKINKAEK